MIVLVLALVAAIVAVLVLVQSRGTALLAWGLLALALIHIIPAVS